MMKRIKWSKWLLSLVIMLLTYSAEAQAQEMRTGPFKGHYYNEEERVHIHLDLYEATLEAPGMEFLGKIHGYIQGNIYGIWLLTSYKVKDNVATLRFSNDTGGDAQGIEFTYQGDRTFEYRTVGGNCIKKIEKRKLVKIPNHLLFELVSQ